MKRGNRGIGNSKFPVFPLSLFPFLDCERVARIELLKIHQNLVDVVGMRGLSRQFVPQHLKKVFESAGIVDVNIRPPIILSCGEAELQISVTISGLETSLG